MQYFHIRNYNYRLEKVLPKGGTTVAIEMPSSALLDTMEIGGVYLIDIGIARCHEEDLYNKKIGRNVAVGRIGSKPCKVVSKYIGHDSIFVSLEYSKYKINIEKKFTGTAQLIYVSELT